MQLRPKNYPPKFWLRLHTHTWIGDPPLPPRKARRPSEKKIDVCLSSLVPHLQWLVYRGSVDRKKGEIRSVKLPLSAQQFNVIEKLGATRTFSRVMPIEQAIQLQCNFEHKGYARGIDHIQFRLQTQKSIIPGKNPAHILRIRFHQKRPILIE